ncbi:DUF637 domain-containing protein [Neisseria sp.]|uniref:DUF637 domain-containing protein n=1 Tax=Neisseria sp. TaxID=192066 RepID=UPI0034C6C062
MVLDAAKIKTGASLYGSSGGGAALGKNVQITAQDDITMVSGQKISSQGSFRSEKGGIRLEAGAFRPSAEAPATPADVHIGGSLNAAKPIAVVAEGNLKTGLAPYQRAGQVYLHAGKNLTVAADSAGPASAKNISIKAGEAASLTAPSPKTLAAGGNFHIEAGSITTDKTNLKAGGNLGLYAGKGDVRLGGHTRLDAGGNLEVASHPGHIGGNSLSAHAAGYVSLLSEGNTELKGQTSLSGKDIYAGSVGKGFFRAEQADFKAEGGDIHLLAGGGMEAGTAQARSSIRGNHVTIQNKGANAVLRNLDVHARNGALSVHSDRALGLDNAKLESAHNMQLNAQNERITLNQVDAYAHRHMSLTAQGKHSGQIWQNDKSSGTNKLVANGVLSLNSRYSQIADNTTLRAGAINLTAGTALIKRGNINWSTVPTKTMENIADLKPLAGKIHIEAGSGTMTFEPANRVAAHTDLTVKTGGRLVLAGKGGQAGVASARMAALSAKRNLNLIAGEADIKGARIGAGGDLTLAATKGSLNIEGVENTFSKYLPVQKAADLSAKKQELENQIAALQAANPQNSLIPTLRSEQERLDFYINAINKTVKEKMPKGREYTQTVLNGRNVRLLAAQGIDISATDINAGKKLTLHAAGLLPRPAGSDQAAIFVDGAVDRYEIGKPTYKSHYDKAALNKPSRLTGNEGIDIHAAAEHEHARVVIGASELKAPAGGIQVKAYSDIALAAGLNDAYTFLKTKSRSGKLIRKTQFTSTRDHLIYPAPSELSAGNGIRLEAGGNINADTTRFNAPQGKVRLTAGEALNLLATEGIHSHRQEVEKTRRFLGIKINRSQYSKNELDETKLPVRVIAQNADTRSGWDTVLEGTEFQTTLSGADIQAGVGAKARKNAKIILKGIVERVRSEEQKESNSVIWQTTAGKGSTVETLKLPRFEGPAAPKLTAPGGYIAHMPKGNLKTEIEKLARKPEHAYLKQLRTNKNVDWKQVNLAYDQWDYEAEGLTGAGAAIITIIVTALTYGAGSGLAAGAGTTATATGTTVAGGTTLASSMGTAALAALNSKAAVSLINNKGNIGKTLKELGRSDTVKTMVSAAVTAGIADKLGAAAEWNNYNKSWADRLTTNLATGTATAMADTALNGGSLQESLERGILNALVQHGHMETSARIKGLDNHYIAHKIAHAVAGCAAASANKGQCTDGAIGAAVGEIVGDAMVDGRNPNNLTPAERHKILSYSKIIAGSVAALNNGDVDAAANAAQVAVVNNSLNRLDGLTPDERRLEEIKKQYGTDIGKIANKISKGEILLTKELADHIYRINTDPKLTLEVNVQGWNVYVDKNSTWKPNPSNRQETFTVGRIPYSNFSRWAVHGHVSVIRGVDGKYRLSPEQYDFEMHKFSGKVKNDYKVFYRNTETIIGSPGKGIPFEIKFKGDVNVVH